MCIADSYLIFHEPTPSNPSPLGSQHILLLICFYASDSFDPGALGLAELHEVCMSPPLQPVTVPLDGITSLQCANHTTEHGADSKLDECALYPTVTDKDVKQHWSQYQALRNTTCH